MINRYIKLDKPLSLALTLVAEEEKQTLDEVSKKMLRAALQHRQEKVKNLKTWQTLTRREKEITTLVCLGHTNKEIADKLFIAAGTVKTHTRNIRRKFGMRSKLELRKTLDGWKFGQGYWEVTKEEEDGAV